MCIYCLLDTLLHRTDGAGGVKHRNVYADQLARLLGRSGFCCNGRNRLAEGQEQHVLAFELGCVERGPGADQVSGCDA
jgi:hypothetical protein